MVAKALLVTILAAAIAAGCTRTPSSAQLIQLVTVAPAVLSQATPDGEIPAKHWPSAVTKLSPERVYSSSDGLYLVLSSSFVEERGLFVPRSAGFAGSNGTDPSYTAVGQGVFSYRIKG